MVVGADHSLPVWAEPCKLDTITVTRPLNPLLTHTQAHTCIHIEKIILIHLEVEEGHLFE